jgi:hypothetical protein
MVDGCQVALRKERGEGFFKIDSMIAHAPLTPAAASPSISNPSRGRYPNARWGLASQKLTVCYELSADFADCIAAMAAGSGRNWRKARNENNRRINIQPERSARPEQTQAHPLSQGEWERRASESVPTSKHRVCGIRPDLGALGQEGDTGRPGLSPSSYIAPTTSFAISYPKKTAVAKQAAARKTSAAVTACGMPHAPDQASGNERRYFDLAGFSSGAGWLMETGSEPGKLSSRALSSILSSLRFSSCGWIFVSLMLLSFVSPVTTRDRRFGPSPLVQHFVMRFSARVSVPASSVCGDALGRNLQPPETECFMPLLDADLKFPPPPARSLPP